MAQPAASVSDRTRISEIIRDFRLVFPIAISIIALGYSQSKSKGLSIKTQPLTLLFIYAEGTSGR